MKYNSLSLTERSSLLASCFSKYNILHLFSSLLYPPTNSGQFFLFPQILIGFLPQSTWLMRRMLRVRMLMMRRMYYLLVQIYWPVYFWNMTPVLNFHYFLSNQICLKRSKQCGYIRVLSYVDSKNSCSFMMDFQKFSHCKIYQLKCLT